MMSYDGLKLTELISMEISSIKHRGDQRLSPDVLFSRTFSQTTYRPSQKGTSFWVTRHLPKRQIEVLHKLHTSRKTGNMY